MQQEEVEALIRLELLELVGEHCVLDPWSLLAVLVQLVIQLPEME